MSIEQKTEPPKKEIQPVISRRNWLKRVGIGAGATFLFISGGSVWRAEEQGLFSMGQGLA